ncbi:MAG: hypothetical protein ACFHU9_11100 [Fluviicola sp.]
MAQELLNKHILWYKKKMQAFGGRMVVTEDRFSFHQAPKWAAMFGALGAAIAAGSKGKALIDDEIKNLQFAKGRTMGKKSYMLEVTDANGTKYDFLFDDKLLAQVESAITLAEPATAE